jgi:hypothetical protein
MFRKLIQRWRGIDHAPKVDTTASQSYTAEARSRFHSVLWVYWVSLGVIFVIILFILFMTL